MIIFFTNLGVSREYVQPKETTLFIYFYGREYSLSVVSLTASMTVILTFSNISFIISFEILFFDAEEMNF